MVFLLPMSGAAFVGSAFFDSKAGATFFATAAENFRSTFGGDGGGDTGISSSSPDEDELEYILR